MQIPLVPAWFYLDYAEAFCLYLDDRQKGRSIMGALPQFRTIEEVCHRLTLSRPAVARLIARKELPVARIGRRVVILEADLAAWMMAQSAGRQAETQWP